MTQEISGETITIVAHSKTEVELIQKIHQLNELEQQHVLDYIGQLKVIIRPEGIRGEDLIQTIRELSFDAESLREMQEAIEEFLEAEPIIEDINLDE